MADQPIGQLLDALGVTADLDKADDVVHAAPLDDGMIHEFTTECPCGPTPITVPGGLILSHASLDGRERQEAS